MDGLAAPLPDARIGAWPDVADVIRGFRKPAADVSVDAAAAVRVERGGLEEGAGDVEVGLLSRAVAATHRTGAAVAGQRQRPLKRAGAPVEAVEHLQAWVGEL